MKKYTIVMVAVVASLLTIVVLGVANYYTFFTYNLPHRPAVIEVAPQDTLLQFHPEWIAIPGGSNQTTINTTINWTKGIESDKTEITGGSYDWITPEELLGKPIASLTLWELNVLVDYCATKANANPDVRSTKWPIMTTVYQNEIIIRLLGEYIDSCYPKHS